MSRRSTLGPLERKIMDYMWTHDESTVHDIHLWLKVKKKIAYTTVLTILDRLHAKKIVSRKIIGRAFVYKPRLSRAQLVQGIIKNTVKVITDGYGTDATTAFVQGIKLLPREERERIITLLNEVNER